MAHFFLTVSTYLRSWMWRQCWAYKNGGSALGAPFSAAAATVAVTPPPCNRLPGKEPSQKFSRRIFNRRGVNGDGEGRGGERGIPQKCPNQTVALEIFSVSLLFCSFRFLFPGRVTKSFVFTNCHFRRGLCSDSFWYFSRFFSSGTGRKIFHFLYKSLADPACRGILRWPLKDEHPCAVVCVILRFGNEQANLSRLKDGAFPCNKHERN